MFIITSSGIRCTPAVIDVTIFVDFLTVWIGPPDRATNTNKERVDVMPTESVTESRLHIACRES